MNRHRTFWFLDKQLTKISADLTRSISKMRKFSNQVTRNYLINNIWLSKWNLRPPNWIYIFLKVQYQGSPNIFSPKSITFNIKQHVHCKKFFIATLWNSKNFNRYEMYTYTTDTTLNQFLRLVYDKIENNFYRFYRIKCNYLDIFGASKINYCFFNETEKFSSFLREKW